MNRLSKETSLYLQQHAENPVDWWPWSEEALQRARSQDKLLIISIGYSSCHWCHVMEKESFEDEKVAVVMNKDFVSIKVDREERPDVDHSFMDAVHLMGRQGGWPLNVVALPDGRPVWGGTYFRKDDWLSILDQLAVLFRNDREKMVEYAGKLSSGVFGIGQALKTSADQEPDLKAWLRSVESLKTGFDREFGGMSRAPKFPMPQLYKLMLQAYATNRDSDLLDHVTKTLERMALGGIYDQVGGGFARYSVDERWKVPHFEKMLYDNAQLLELYAIAYKVTKNKLFLRVVTETVNWLADEMEVDSGSYAAALDADSENGVEGEFYAWTEDELEEALGSDSQKAKTFWQVGKAGLWENGKSILLPSTPEQVTGAREWKASLNKYRKEKKSKPKRDDKGIVAWNAMLANGLITAYDATGKAEYRDKAIAILNQILERRGSNGLPRLLENDNTHGFLDDYAHTIEACISIVESTGRLNYLKEAQDLMELVITDFSINDGPMLLYSRPLTDSPFSSKVEIQDNVIPSSNAVMAVNLFKLGNFLLNSEYKTRSLNMLKAMGNSIHQNPEFHAKWLELQGLASSGFQEVVVSGDKADEIHREIGSWYWPNKLILNWGQNSDLLLLEGKGSDGPTKIFICEEGVCQLPHNSLRELGEISGVVKNE